MERGHNEGLKREGGRDGVVKVVERELGCGDGDVERGVEREGGVERVSTSVTILTDIYILNR